MSSGKMGGGGTGHAASAAAGAAQMAVDSVWVFLGRTLTLTLIINKGHLPWSAWLITTHFRPSFLLRYEFLEHGSPRRRSSFLTFSVLSMSAVSCVICIFLRCNSTWFVGTDSPAPTVVRVGAYGRGSRGRKLGSEAEVGVAVPDAGAELREK